ncbi:TIGR03943 family putative permease subunit [Streptomyces sp. WM6378]|uniref:TIGR03943 family putative permease subunit n=1 Tax=Streptomyces sp. WM6378 TaxID=1415557 RepID=UPI002D21C555|nr:TIGR03943 family protein [Streptomyces sp. WM6378]
MAAVRKLLPAALLVLVGCALLRISLLSDLYLRYVKEGLQPLLIASGVVLVLLGLMAFFRVRHHDGQEATDHGHTHSAAGPKTAWLLGLPAVMLLLFAPPALGSYTVARDGSGAVAKRTTFAALPAQSPLALTLTDFTSRAVWDEKGSLKGRTVRLTGFVTPANPDSWQLSRVIVSCCAADARVVKVEIHGIAVPPADSWVTVTGEWRPDAKAPALDATGLNRIPQPKNPYRDTAQP